MTRATTPNVFDSAALPLLFTLQEQGFELRVTNGALFIKPVDRVTLELRAQLRQHKPALMTLVCVCEQGVQDRVTVFRAQLEASPHDGRPVPVHGGCALQQGDLLLVRRLSAGGLLRSLLALLAGVAVGRRCGIPAEPATVFDGAGVNA